MVLPVSVMTKYSVRREAGTKKGRRQEGQALAEASEAFESASRSTTRVAGTQN